MRPNPPGKLSDLEFDPAVPAAYPVTGVADLMGNMPVRVRAEGAALVAYGFGNQRVEVPRAQIGSVLVHHVRNSKGDVSNPSLAVLDHQGRLLLRVRGKWGPGLEEVCLRLNVRGPRFESSRPGRSRALLGTRAEGFAKVRVWPRGYVSALIAGGVVALTVLAWCGIGGVQLALLLPGAIGGARNLIALGLAVACVTAGLWLVTAAWRFLVGALRWAVVSRRAASPAPPSRFLRVTGASKWTTVLPTVALVLSVPTLLIWGIAVEGVTISHGFRDQALVAGLRQHGVGVAGTVIDVPYYTTDSNGDQEQHDRATLSFTTADGLPIMVADPAVAGWTWPMDPNEPVRVVYDPANPETAAVVGQITGSPWHGAPTGNLAGGAVAILMVPPLAWLCARRLTASRRRLRDEAIEGISLSLSAPRQRVDCAIDPPRACRLRNRHAVSPSTPHPWPGSSRARAQVQGTSSDSGLHRERSPRDVINGPPGIGRSYITNSNRARITLLDLGSGIPERGTAACLRLLLLVRELSAWRRR